MSGTSAGAGAAGAAAAGGATPAGSSGSGDLHDAEEDLAKSASVLTMDDEKKRNKSVGRNNHEYRAIRRQSIKQNNHSPTGSRGRQGSVVALKGDAPTKEERPQRPKAVVIPQLKKRAKEAVGRYVSPSSSCLLLLLLMMIQTDVLVLVL